jgi:hypothetical protein
MIVAFDTFRYKKFAYTVGAVFDFWDASKPKYYVTSKRPFKAGESEVNYILECLKMLDEYDITHILVDGYVWTTSDGVELNKGFGAYLSERLDNMWISHPTVIGVTDKEFPKPIPYSVEIVRGDKEGSLWVTSSEYFLTESDAKLVRNMHGNEVIPTIIQCVKNKIKEYLGNEEELDK